MVEMKHMQRLTMLVNTVLLGCMCLGLISFHSYGISYMVYHCIPTIIVFAAAYLLAYKGLLYHFVLIIYAALAIYTVAATVCLGYDAGFHLSFMSLIPLTFYMGYLAQKLGLKKLRALPVSLALVVVYLICSGYVILKGPVYQVEPVVACRFMYFNAIVVFCFLIGYANFMVKLVTASEQKLTDMAHKDQLTGLFNRHYMTKYLDALEKDPAGHWMAMADIDDFKNINDTYGHNCGDYVLVELSKIMLDVCNDCTVARWGGEEFLIVGNSDISGPEMMETLRQRVGRACFSHQDVDIPVTITVGVALCRVGQPSRSWIQSADATLYTGKAGGKNRVVYALAS